MRLHLVSGNGELQHLDISSKFDNEWPFIERLHGRGRQAADAWLAAHGDQVGPTLDTRAIHHPETAPGPRADMTRGRRCAPAWSGC